MSDESWYLQRGKSASIGPFSTKEIVEGLTAGEIPRDSMVCAVDGKHWLPLDAIEAFRDVLSSRKATTTDAARVSVRTGDAAAPLDETQRAEPPPASSEPATPAGPRPRPRPTTRTPPREEAPPSPARLRAVAILAGACAAVSLSRLVLAVARPRAIALLVDAARGVRLDLGIGAALASTAWIAIAVAARPGRRRVGAAVIAAGVPLVASLAVAAIAVVRIRSAVTLGGPELIVRAQRIVAIFAVGSLAAYATVLATLTQNVAAAARRAAGPTAVVTAISACAAGLVHLGVSRVEVVPIAVESEVPIPLFEDDASVHAFVSGTRAGASGLPLLDRALERAAFVDPGTRARVVDEDLLDAEGGPALLRKVVPLDGPHAGRTLVWVVR